MELGKQNARSQIGLRHLHRLTAVVAVMIWLSQHLWIEIAGGHSYGSYSAYFILRWDDHSVIEWISPYTPQVECGGCYSGPPMPGPITLPTPQKNELSSSPRVMPAL